MRERTAKPFLKWAGGKSQLIDQLTIYLPEKVMNREFVYIEPFVGGGAVLFWLLNIFPYLKRAVINDVNQDLINAYRVIAANPKELISILEIFQFEFHSLKDDLDKRKAYYYSKRAMYNERKQCSVTHAALFILLNHTCFNGLYRVNRNNYLMYLLAQKQHRPSAIMKIYWL